MVITAVTGTSGAGKSLKPHLLGAEVMGSLSAYGVGGVHRHTPEIVQNLSAAAGRPVSVSFTPVLAPLPRGILATLLGAARRRRRPTPARPTPRPTPTSRSCTCCPRAPGRRTAATLGANTVHLQVTVDPDAGRLVVVAAIDNLTKGTAGGAVQCMNLALGLPETTGLPLDRSGAVSVCTTPAGLPGAPGSAAGIKTTGAPDLALVVNDGPAVRRGRACSPATRSRPRRCCGRSRCSTDRAAARGRAQLRRRQRLHRPGGLPDHARHRRAGRRAARRCGAIEVAVCSTGLIGAQLPRGRGAGRGRPARSPRWPPTPAAGLAAATAIMTTDTVAKQAAHTDAGRLEHRRASPRAPA